MTPLRVLYLIDSLGPGGAQRQLVTLVRGLDRTVVAPDVAIYHPLHHFRPDLESAGVTVHTLDGSGGRDPRVFMGLARLMKRGRYDIVHSYLRTPGALVRLAAPVSSRTRIVVSERSVGLGRSPVRLAVERMLCRRASAMITNSEVFAREIEKLVPAWIGRTYVVPNGVGFVEPSEEERAAARDFRARHIGGSEYLIGVVGRIAHEKAPDLLVSALERLPREALGRLRIAWVGPRVDRELARIVESRLSDPALAGRVAFLGEARDTRTVYLGVDGILLCSRREGLPNVVLEGLAHGRPVIATDVGDTGKLLAGGSAGWLVPPEDPDALAHALMEFVATSPEDLADMGRRGSEFVLDEYSISKLVERTMDVYHEVTGLVPGTGEDHRGK